MNNPYKPIIPTRPLLWAILTGSWDGMNGYEPPAPIRAFYRVKAVICAWMMLWPYSTVNPNLYPGLDIETDGVYVTCRDSGSSRDTDPDYDMSWYKIIVVGRGLFKNWWITFDEGTD